jgi:hypothetical protein
MLELTEAQPHGSSPQKSQIVLAVTVVQCNLQVIQLLLKILGEKVGVNDFFQEDYLHSGFPCVVLLASETLAWRGDTEACNGATAGEYYMTTLKKSHKEDGILTRASSMLQPGLKKSAGGSCSKGSNITPAPTHIMASTCPPS